MINFDPIKENNDVDKIGSRAKQGKMGIKEKILNPRKNSFRSGQLIHPTSGSCASSQEINEL